ncbi:MAG: hypothetical protein ACMZ7B_07765 [Balneola sp.]
MGKQIIELAPFTLKEGYDQQNLLLLSKELEENFLTHQQGYLKRVLLQKTEKEFMDIVYWNSMEEAKTAMDNAMKSKTCANYFSCMAESESEDPSSVVQHFSLLESYSI